MESCCSDKYNDLLSRLEKTCDKLEGKEPTNIKDSLQSVDNINNLSDYWKKQLDLLSQIRQFTQGLNDPDLARLTETFVEGVCYNNDIMEQAEHYVQPSRDEAQKLCKKLSSFISSVEEVKKEKPQHSLFADVVHNCLDALTWVFSGDSALDTVKTYADAVDFPGNKIHLQKNADWSKWVKSVKAIMKELVTLVDKNFKKNGLNWNSKGNTDVSLISLTFGNNYRNYFIKKDVEGPSKETRDNVMKSIQGFDSKATLKATKTEEKSGALSPVKVHSKAEVEAEERFTKCQEGKRGRRVTLTKRGKKEDYSEQTGALIIENFEGEKKEFDPELLKPKTTVAIYNCIDCIFRLPKKVNGVKLTNCDNVRVYVENLMSSFEITSSVKVSVVVSGTVNLFTIDSSIDTQLHLPPASQAAKIYVTQSTASHVIVLNDSLEEVNEVLIPEQFNYTVSEDKSSIQAKVSELYDY